MAASASPFTWITPSLAVGGAVAAGAAEALARGDGVRAVIDLRAEACDDETEYSRHGIAFLHLPTDDLCALSPKMLADGVAFAERHLAAGERVLVHCQHGIGRSATLALAILVAGGMPPLDALELAKSRRSMVSPSPPQYEAWAAWLRERAAATGATWTVPDFEAFKRIAYRHLLVR